MAKSASIVMKFAVALILLKQTNCDCKLELFEIFTIRKKTNK